MKRKKAVSYEEGLIARLKDPEYAAEYLDAILSDASEDQHAIFLLALQRVAKAQGMTNVARGTELTRDTLYKALSKTGDPRFSTLEKILDQLDLRLSVQQKAKKTG